MESIQDRLFPEDSDPNSGQFLMAIALLASEDRTMTYPRSQIVSEDEAGVYHVVSHA